MVSDLPMPEIELATLYIFSASGLMDSQRFDMVHRGSSKNGRPMFKRFLPLLAILSAIVLLPAVAAKAQNAPTLGFPVGAAGIGAKYHFTQDPPSLEEAKVMAGLGARAHKFNLAPVTPNNWTLLQTAQQDAAIASILAQHFDIFVFWAYSQNASNAAPSPTDATADNVFAPQHLANNYREIYDLVVWLRTTYNGTNRSFFIGDWEMDNKMACLGACDPLPATIDNVIAWENTRQQAVDDAKAATPGSTARVWHYAEINSVQQVMSGSTKPRMINAVMPHINPDYVSYSAWDSLWRNVTTLPDALTYIQAHMMPKPSVPGARVFVGEFGAKASYWGPERQNSLSLSIIQEALNWGVPLMFYWAVYDNSTSGYWLIDSTNIPQPIYYSFQERYKASQ